MTKLEVVKKTREYIKRLMSGEGTGHDWFHIDRVVKNAKLISKKEGGDMFIIELSALLHDIADWKFHDGDMKIGARKTEEWLKKLGVEAKDIQKVVEIVEHISYKGGTNKRVMQSIEGKIVQDADRLDAIGALGIARVFAFGGSMKRAIHDPSIKPKLLKSFEAYKKRTQTSINHFYEKLLLLKNKMNTNTGKQLAQKRHEFMEKYLEQFYSEWDGKA